MNVIRNLKDWEVEEYENLLLILSQIPLENCNDQLMWKLSKNGIFSVKNFYKHLTCGDGNERVLFPEKQIWKTKSPPKVTFFVGNLAITSFFGAL